MTDKKKKTIEIIIFIITCCAIMAFVETVIEPTYVIKSAIKAVVFLLLPLIFARVADIKLFDHSFALNRKSIIKLLALGCCIYAIIIGAYALTKNIFDYSVLVESLSTDQNVDGDRFVWVALYISFCNSFLEEFLFRFVSFIELLKYTSRKLAYVFSSVIFAVYHIAMLGASFPPILLFLVVIGLAVGGCIFDFVDEKSDNIYNSWIIHMFADFAIMTIWYINI